MTEHAENELPGLGERSVGDLLGEAARRLAELPHTAPRLEAELLLCEATGLNRTALIAWPESRVEPAGYERFEAMLARRLSGEPIAHIRGRQEFWGLELRITPATLIPRPETELLVEIALEQLPEDAPLLVLDAGCGSGAIAAALARERPAWTLFAADRSMAAARVAQRNLCEHSPGNAHVLVGDWLSPIADGRLHAIVGNPPYIADTDPHLMQGDLPREPRGALAAGPDGLNALREIASEATHRLHRGGLLALEHGFDQGRAVRDILARHDYVNPVTRRDLAGQERVTTALRPR